MDQSAYSVRLSKKGLDYQEVMHDFGAILVNTVDSNKLNIPLYSTLMLKQLMLCKNL